MYIELMISYPFTIADSHYHTVDFVGPATGMIL